MPGPAPVLWLDRVAESLREHEDRTESLQSAPPRYEILHEVSRGGMGIVYLAWDPQLGRNVALKVLRSDGGSAAAEACERFQREAKLAAALHHPNIVQVLDTGRWKGQDYIAMQFIEGVTLDQAMSDRRTALGHVRDAARALHYAHERGIVHRDVKPGNLLVDSTGRVFVTDFGVARQAVAAATITSPGTVVGTPAYMSPEQAQGVAADARSDVYSLGATLYELVLGRPPYPGSDASEVLEAVRSKDPEAPCRAAPDLSRNVEAIILGAMERSRDERYPSAAALADDIDRYLGGERPLRRPRGLSYRIRRQFVRHPWLSAGAVALAVLFMLAGTFIGYWVRGYLHLKRGMETTDLELRMDLLKVAAPWFSEAEREVGRLQEEKNARLARLRDEDAKRRIEDQRRKDADTHEKLRGELDKARRRELIAETTASARKYLDEGTLPDARKVMDVLRDESPENYSALLPKLRALEFGSHAAALSRQTSLSGDEEFSRIHAILKDPVYRDVPDRNRRLAGPVLQRALRLRVQGRHSEAVRWFDEAEALDVREARLYEQRGLSLMELGQWERAQTDMDLVFKHSSAGSRLPPEYARLSHRRGRAALQEGNWSEAVAQFENALLLDPGHVPSLHDRGIARYRFGVAARDILHKDLGTALQRDPALMPDVLYRDVAVSYARAQAERLWKAEDLREREAAWREARSWLDAMGRKCGDTEELALERAGLDRRLRDYDAGLTELRDLANFPKNLLLRGQLRYLKAFRLGKDAALLADALADFDQAVGGNPSDPRAHYWRGTCRNVLKDFRGAAEDLRSARTLGLDSPDVNYQLSRVHVELKEYAAAAESASAALQRAEAFGDDEQVSNLYEHQGLSRTAGLKLFERDALSCRATARFYLREYRDAADDCTRILNRDPQFISALILRGDAACQDKRHEDARRDYAAVLTSSASKEDKDLTSVRRDRCSRH